MVNLQGDAADDPRGKSADLARILGIGLGVRALDDAQGFVAKGNFAVLTA
jgi:hypothetical protein